MAEKSFDDFVRQEQQAVKVSDEKQVDWQGRKSEWLQHLVELFEQVNGYLKPYADAGDVSIEYRAVDLNEEYIGSYTAREMIITIGRKTFKLEPIGALIIGSKGRVDLVGSFARANFLLLDSKVTSTSPLIHVSVSMKGAPFSPPPAAPPPDTKWVWRIVTRPPQREIIELNEKTFLNLLVELSNG
jgi:hypothetical protein